MDVLGESSERGVLDIRFDSVCEGRKVPGVLFAPAEGETRGLVVGGHGATQDKRALICVALGRRFVRHHNIAVVSIDAPGHGDRDGVALGQGSGWWTPTSIDETIADWKQVVVECSAHLGIGAVPLGFIGLGLSTTLGIPYIASEPRMRAASLGLVGYSAVWRRVSEDAPRVRCPVMWHALSDDDLITPDKTQQLFDLMGSSEKELRWSEGHHLGVPESEFVDAEAFIARHMLGAE